MFGAVDETAREQLRHYPTLKPFCAVERALVGDAPVAEIAIENRVTDVIVATRRMANRDARHKRRLDRWIDAAIVARIADVNRPNTRFRACRRYGGHGNPSSASMRSMRQIISSRF